MEDYCAEYNFITRCRFYSAGQQQQCKGYIRRMDKASRQCAHWVPLGDGEYRCDNHMAQAAAIDEFKRNNMEPGGAK